MGKSTISMAMFNSYVCLPEDTNGWERSPSIQKVPRGKVATVADFPTENYALQETVGQNPGTRMIS